ncbi:MAG: FdtA/QdtA family cupin domain-containing protein [Alphaproteobacteria bacterium]|nr:FdtA/QdtA family cupin domain-containing protein [Alphaproteobacteria bacterium]
MRCREIVLKTIKDARGTLTVAQGLADLPFEIRRVFYLTDLRPDQPRGGHAHRETHQAIFCLSGSVELQTKGREQIDDQSWILDEPSTGIYLPPMTWVDFRATSPTALCIVFASTVYSEDDYVHDSDQLRPN